MPQLRYAGDECRVPLRKALALVAYLAIDGAMHPRDELVALLWPEADERKGRMVLRTCLSVLRRTLDAMAGAPPILRVAADALGLERSATVVDVHELASAAALARQPTAPPGLRSQLESAIALYRGPLLHALTLPDAPDFEAWVLAQRTASHRHLSTALARLAGLQEEAGDLQAAATTLCRWLEHDPLEESACQRLIAVRLAAGDPASGVQTYEDYRARLATEVGVEPGIEIQALAERAATAMRRPEPLRQPRALASGTLHMPLVGRAAEVVALRQRYVQMCAGRAQVVILEGEEGIGKSRLAHEFLAWTDAQGADVLEGRAVELGGAVPYAVLVEALRPRVERENAPDDLVDGTWLARLAHLLPELCERYPDLPGAAGADSAQAADLYEAVVRLVQALALQRPLVLFLDDLQWADPATLSLVLYAARRWSQCGARVLLLLATTADFLGMAPALDDWLALLSRETYTLRLVLGPLAEGSTIQLVELLTGPTQEQETTTAAQFGRWLHRATGGRPFCILDLLLHLLDAGALRLHQMGGEWLLDVGPVLCEPGRLSDAVPARLSDVVRGQMARLGPVARELLIAGAALGTRFSFAYLRHVAGVAEQEALEAVDTLLRACLLHEERDTGWFAFSYDALRAVLLAQAGAARRCLYQKRAVALLAAEQAMIASALPALAGRSSERTALDLVPKAPTTAARTAQATLPAAGEVLMAIPALWSNAEATTPSMPDALHPGVLRQVPRVGGCARRAPRRWPPHRCGDALLAQRSICVPPGWPAP
jgi:DNA-binding SARP family transcriptional activator